MLLTLTTLILLTQAMLPVVPDSRETAISERVMPTSPSDQTVGATSVDAKIFKTVKVDFPQQDKTGSVVIDITRGFVDVTTHDKPHVVIEVLNPPAKNEAYDTNGLKQQFAPTYELDVDKSKNRITLDTYNNTYILNLRVKVPKQTNLSLDTYRDGYLRVKGVTGTIHTHSQHCDISLLDISGAATAFSYNGDLTVEFKSVAKDAELDFESYNGSIELTLPADIHATTAIAAGRGSCGSMFDIQPIGRLSDPRIARLYDATAESYQFGEINGGGVGIRIESEKGEIALRKLPL